MGIVDKVKELLGMGEPTETVDTSDAESMPSETSPVEEQPSVAEEVKEASVAPEAAPEMPSEPVVDSAPADENLG